MSIGENIQHQNDGDVKAEGFSAAGREGSAGPLGRWSRRGVGPSLLRRGVVAGALTLGAMGGAVVFVAPSADAVAVGTVACESQSQRSYTYNFLGQIVHGVTNSVKVCAKLYPNGWRFLTPTTNASHQEQYLWNWVGWNGNYKSGGAGSTSFTYYIKGTFKQCTSVCWLTESNWVKQTATIKNPRNVNIGGTYGMDIVWGVTGGRSVDSEVKNQAPVAQANSMGFTFRPADPIGTQKCNSINVLTNDADPDGDALTAAATGANFTNNAPAGTYFTLQPNGTFSICVTRGAANSFSPANPLAVSYVATDSKGAQSQPVNVVIAPSLVNSAPTAGSNSMGFTFRAADPVGTQKCNAIDVLTNDGDADGDPLAAVATGANFNNNAPNGTYFTMQPNGTFSICVTRGAANSFSPANPLLVTYVAVDNQGAQSQPVNIFITPSLV